MVIEEVGTCPECGNSMVKAGKQRVNRKGDMKQIYYCLRCGRRTVNPVMGSRVGRYTVGGK